MAYVDPWGGFNEGMQGLGQTFSQLSASERQRQIDERAKKEFDIRMAEHNQEQETRKGLASIYDLSKQTKDESYPTEVPNPEYDSWKAAKESPEGIASVTPGAETTLQGVRDSLAGSQQEPPRTLAQTATRQVPMYSPTQIQQKAADYMASKGDWAGLKGIESAMDVTSKIDQRSQSMLTNMMKSVHDMREAGLDTDSIKIMLRQQAENMNRLAGKTVFDPKMVDNIDINATGDLIYQDIGGGQKAIMITQPNGTVTVHVVDTTKERRLDSKDQELELQRQRIAQSGQRLNLSATNPATSAAVKGLQKQLADDVPRWTKAVDTYQGLIDQLDKNPDIGGFYGSMKSFFAPYVPGVEKMEDAAAFQSIANAMRGQNRMAVIGPGAMSDYEGKILASVSGAGGKITPTAAKKLLEFWRDNASQNLNNYDTRVNNLAPYSESGAAVSRRPGVSVAPTGVPQNPVFGGQKGASTQNGPPAYDKRTQKLQSRQVNGVTEYRVVPK